MTWWWRVVLLLVASGLITHLCFRSEWMVYRSLIIKLILALIFIAGLVYLSLPLIQLEYHKAHAGIRLIIPAYDLAGNRITGIKQSKPNPHQLGDGPTPVLIKISCGDETKTITEFAWSERIDGNYEIEIKEPIDRAKGRPCILWLDNIDFSKEVTVIPASF